MHGVDVILSIGLHVIVYVLFLNIRFDNTVDRRPSTVRNII
jgi:hypothetical protein